MARVKNTEEVYVFCDGFDPYPVCDCHTPHLRDWIAGKRFQTAFLIKVVASGQSVQMLLQELEDARTYHLALCPVRASPRYYGVGAEAKLIFHVDESRVAV